MRFQLDVMLANSIAEIARAQGLDVISSQEAGRNGLSDEEQLRLAALDGRCLVTRDVGDVERVSRDFAVRGEPHAGVLVVTRRFPDKPADRIARALVEFARVHPEGVQAYLVAYL